MKKILLMLLLASLSAGCGEPHTDTDGHAHHDADRERSPSAAEHDGHGDENSGAEFVAGRGVRLSAEARTSLGVELLTVSGSAAEFELEVNAQIYRESSEPDAARGERHGHAYATALAPPAAAARMRAGQPVKCADADGATGAIWKIETAQVAALGKTELLAALPDAGGELKIGDFVRLKIPVAAAGDAVAIPKSALLETAQGNFVYARDGEFFQRREVTAGAGNAADVEIISGLKPGEVIVSAPVEVLYLIELKAVKGGGHGH